MVRLAGWVFLLTTIAGCTRSTDEPAPAAATPKSVPAAEVVRAPGPVRKVDGVVAAALRWLKSRQATDGSWDGDVGTTGLALLAFLGAGETHQSGTCRETVKNGLKYLRDRQDADGFFGPRTSPRFLDDHALAALAMNEAYGMTSSKAFAVPAQKGLAFALATRTPGGGWHRAAPGGRNEPGWVCRGMSLARTSLGG